MLMFVIQTLMPARRQRWGVDVDPASRPWPGPYSTEEGAASDDECRIRGGLIRRTKRSFGHHCLCRLDHCAKTVCPQPQHRVSSSSTRNPSVSATSIVCRLCRSSGCLHTTFLPMFEDNRAKVAEEWRKFLVFAQRVDRKDGCRKT